MLEAGVVGAGVVGAGVVGAGVVGAGVVGAGVVGAGVVGAGVVGVGQFPLHLHSQDCCPNVLSTPTENAIKQLGWLEQESQYPEPSCRLSQNSSSPGHGREVPQKVDLATVLAA